MTRILTVLYGGDTSTRLDIARELAGSLPDKSAVVSVESLLAAIARPDRDSGAELDLVHIQLRLLVANFLKSGYHVVVEGSFFFDRDGSRLSYDQDIDQLAALMRNLASPVRLVHLCAERADEPHRQRSGERYLDFATESQDTTAVVAAIKKSLEGIN